MKDMQKNKPKVKKTEERMLSLEPIKRYRFTEGATFGEGDGPNEEGYA